MRSHLRSEPRVLRSSSALTQALNKNPGFLVLDHFSTRNAIALQYSSHKNAIAPPFKKRDRPPIFIS
ncbi:MAG: hypothetical protein AAGD25_22620 [Cyanobacteria bacterium P01_F01_bin.150]